MALDGNTLIAGDFSDGKTGAIFIYDLESHPIKIKQKLTPPEHIARNPLHSGFCSQMKTKGDKLVVENGGVIYTKDELSKFGITEKDDIVPSWTDGIRNPIGRSSILLYSKDKEGHWAYQKDLYYDLPRPQGGVLRNLSGDVVHIGCAFYEANDISITDDRIFLHDMERYFVFKLHGKSDWSYDYTSLPPFDMFDVVTREERPGMRREENVIERIAIDSSYSARTKSDGTLDVYKTRELREWKPTWTVRYMEDDTVEAMQSYDFHLRLTTQRVQVHGNIMVAYYFWYQHKPMKKSTTPESTAGVSVFEIDERTGPRLVFQMKAFDNGELKIAPIIKQLD